MEHALHDDTFRVAPLRHGRRPTERGSIVLRLGVLSERMEGSLAVLREDEDLAWVVCGRGREEPYK
jgi:hypothetical protein